VSNDQHTNPQPSQHLLWWQRGVVYQIYPRSFKDTTGNGVGDLNGVIDKLDYLNDGSTVGEATLTTGGTEASLGVDAIWLSPFYPSPMADFGYDVADYCDVDPLFGDLAAFDRLVAEAHRRGIKIIVDYVPNHTSDQHPWFIESRRSRDNPRRDWYMWYDPQPDGSPPNNWGSFFGGPAWTFDEWTGQYYLHQFVKEQPELNWRNPQVREAMMDVLRFWMERGVDGFRMDVVGLLIKDAELRDNPPNPDADPDLCLTSTGIGVASARYGLSCRAGSHTTARTATACICRSTSACCASPGRPGPCAARWVNWRLHCPPSPGPTTCWAATISTAWRPVSAGRPRRGSQL